MNKRLRLITAFLVMLTMVVSSSYVFAGTDPAQPAGDDTQNAIEVTAEEAAPEAADDIVLMEGPGTVLDVAEGTEAVDEADVAEDVELMTVVDGQIKATNWTYSDTELDEGEWVQAYSDNKFHVYPIKVTTSGKLWANVQADSTNTSSVVVALGTFDDNTGTFTYNTTTCTLYPGDAQAGFVGIDVKAGTYYVGIMSSGSGWVYVQPYVFSYAARSLSAGKVMLTAGYKWDANGNTVDSAALFKIKPTKTGYIRVFAKEYGYTTSQGYVTLLNSSKKAVSDKLLFTEGSKTKYIAFGVKKGVTYYLKASGFQGDNENFNVYGLQYKIYSATLRSNTSKSKSKTLKRKASYITTAMPANGKSGNQWYKFKVTKKRATQIKIDATYIKSGKVTATIYCGKKKVGKTLTLSKGKVNNINITYSNVSGKAKKGTYYVKLSKSAKANGRYKIKYAK